MNLKVRIIMADNLTGYSTSSKTFPIVCIGGSAGGEDPYIRLVRGLPPESVAAIIIVNYRRKIPTQLHQVLKTHCVHIRGCARGAVQICAIDCSRPLHIG